MQSTSLPATRSISPDAALPTFIMVGAVVNAEVVRAMESLALGYLSPTLGISPFQIVTLFVAAWLSLGHSENTKCVNWWVGVPVLVLVLVPSSALSWLGLAFFAGAQASRTSGDRRLGALLFLALAISALWSSVLLKWIATPVTTAEAYVLGSVLSMLRPDIVQVANIVGNPETHSLIVMSRCTTMDALPAAIVALTAVALLLARPSLGRLWRAWLAMGLLLALGNFVRLCMMAWSADAYDVVHGPIGANLYDGFQTLAVLALGSWAARP